MLPTLSDGKNCRQRSSGFLSKILEDHGFIRSFFAVLQRCHALIFFEYGRKICTAGKTARRGNSLYGHIAIPQQSAGFAYSLIGQKLHGGCAIKLLELPEQYRSGFSADLTHSFYRHVFFAISCHVGCQYAYFCGLYLVVIIR